MTEFPNIHHRNTKKKKPVSVTSAATPPLRAKLQDTQLLDLELGE